MSVKQAELIFEDAVSYHSQAFPPTSIDYGRLIKPLGQAMDAIGRFDQMLGTLKNSDILLSPLRNQEAVVSSRMEGTVSTMDEILQYEADHGGDGEGNENVRSEVVETILYQRALRRAEFAMQQGEPLTEYLIRSLHQALLSFGRGANKSPGKYKTEQNYIIGNGRKVMFVPISAEELPMGMERLMSYINESEEQMLLKVAIAHLEFEALHPFKDGNGRVGRMIITLMLWESRLISEPHFYISGYLEDHKSDYIALMRDVSENETWTEWCIFFLEALEAQAIRNLQIANSISDLYESMKPRFRELLSSKYSIMALDYIFANPVFRNSKFAGRSGIPTGTARRFSPILVDAGLLDVVRPASGRRSAMYSFEPLMDLVRI